MNVFRSSTILKTILIILVIGFLLPNLANGMYFSVDKDALAPPLAIKSPCIAVQTETVESGNNFSIVDDEELLLENEGAFKKDVKLKYLNLLKKRAKEIGLSREGLKRLIDEHLREIDAGESEEKAQQERQKLLKQVRYRSPGQGKYTKLVVSPTKYCPVGCAFCSEKSPLPVEPKEDGSFLTEEGIDKILHILKEENTFEKLTITGRGEPLLEAESCLKLIRNAPVKRIILMTSSFWATSPEKTKIMLKNIHEAMKANPSLERIVLGASMDIFHQTKIPSENIRNIIEIIAENEYDEIEVVLKGVLAEDPDSGDPIENFLEQLPGVKFINEDNLVRVGPGRMKYAEKVAIYKGYAFRVSYDQVGFYGTFDLDPGEVIFSRGSSGKTLDQQTVKWCNHGENKSISIDHNGDVGGYFWGDVPRNISSGNIYKDTFKDILEREQRDPFIRALREEGMGYVLDFASEVDPDKSCRIEKYNTVDGAIIEILKKQPLLLYVTKRLLLEDIASGLIEEGAITSLNGVTLDQIKEEYYDLSGETPVSVKQIATQSEHKNISVAMFSDIPLHPDFQKQMTDFLPEDDFDISFEVTSRGDKLRARFTAEDVPDVIILNPEIRGLDVRRLLQTTQHLKPDVQVIMIYDEYSQEEDSLKAQYRRMKNITFIGLNNNDERAKLFYEAVLGVKGKIYASRQKEFLDQKKKSLLFNLSAPSGKGTTCIISGPSGVGKDTVAERVVNRDPNLKLSVSYTTREPRPLKEGGMEIDGVHYNFVSVEVFKQMIKDGKFLEWAEVIPGQFYGTALPEGDKDILLNIDNEGARQVREKIPDDNVSIFIAPPSVEALKKRLEGRGSETPEQVQKRMKNALKQLAAKGEYDYVVVNEDGELDKTVQEVNNIISNERIKKQQKQYVELETAWAQTFIDTALLRAYEAKKLNQNIIIGLDTSMIPDAQMPYIQGLLTKLTRLSKEKGLNNVLIRSKKGPDLATVIRNLASKAGTPNSNIIFLGDYDVLEKRAFDSFREGANSEEWSFFAGVEFPENMPNNNYIRILEMLTKALNLWAGKNKPQDTQFLQIVQQGKKFYKFIVPDIEPVDYDLLKEIYKGQLKALRAA